MHTTRLENTNLDLTIESDAVTPLHDGDVRALVDCLRAFNAMCDLKKLDMERDAVDLTKHSYEFEGNDGRKWKQSIWVPPTETEQMTFNVTDKWSESEFSLHRPVRAYCINLVRAFGVSKIKVRW